MWEVQGSLWLYAVVGCVTDWQQETRSLSYLGIALPLRKLAAFSPPGVHIGTSLTLFHSVGALPEVKFERNRSLSIVQRRFENLRMVDIRSEPVLLQESFGEGLVADLTRCEGQVLERLAYLAPLCRSCSCKTACLRQRR